MSITSNSKPAERVYFEGSRVIKDFGSRVSHAERTLKSLHTFHRYAGSVRIRDYTVTAATAERDPDKPACLVMPRYDGMVLSEMKKDDLIPVITIVSLWYAQQLKKAEKQPVGFLHGDPILQNIIVDTKRKQIVWIDAVCREATPQNAWLDLLLLTISISFRLGCSRTKEIQQMFCNDIIEEHRTLQNRWLLFRQFLLYSRFFLSADSPIRGKAKAMRLLFTSTMTFLFLLGTGRKKAKGT